MGAPPPGLLAAATAAGAAVAADPAGVAEGAGDWPLQATANQATSAPVKAAPVAHAERVCLTIRIDASSS